MRKWAFWFAALVLLAGLQASLRGLIGAYNYQIVILVGINIILAVSLNLINGVTGQFSIGHAGFYAIGGFTFVPRVFYRGQSIFGVLSFLPLFVLCALLIVFCHLGGALCAG